MTLRTVRLYGALRQFGRDFSFDVASPKEAIQALCCQIPGFEQFLRTAEQRGLVFAVFAGQRNLGEHEVEMHTADNAVIRIAPIIKGSKQGGMFQVILGIALIIVGFWNPMAWGTGATMIMAAGASMALGGVVQMLSPVPKPGGIREQDGNNPGSGFGGPVTTTAQGQPVPLLYGEREIGGAVISGGIYPEDAM